MDSKVPLPIPAYFAEAQQLSTKKAKLALRTTPRERPPKLQMRSSQAVSRLFKKVHTTEKALAVSFQSNGENSLLSKHYDESRSDSYFNQCFTIMNVLGAGSFGKVFKVQSKEDGQFYAVKKSKECFRGERDRRRKLEEVKKHEQLPKHPNCVDFIKAWEEKNHLYIQFELCETSLNVLAEQNHNIPEKLIWIYLVDLLKAVKHLHSHNLLHLDIKPENVFVSRQGVCKLGDFGLVVDQTKLDLSDAIEGDPKYMAPELMDSVFTKAADIFSLGITILELSCDLDLPQCGDAWHQLRRGNLPMEFISHVSPDLRSVITLMLDGNYRARPTAEQLLKLPIVAKVEKRRSTEINLKSWVSYLLFLKNGWNAVLSTYYLVLNWLKMWKWRGLETRIVTPNHNRSLVPLEMTYSDDEADFEADSFIRGSVENVHSGEAAPVFKLLENRHEDSILGDSHCKNFSNFIRDERLANSTPLKNKSVNNGSPILSSKRNHSITGILNLDLSSESDDLGKSIVNPKNLLDVFDNISDDEY